MKAFAENLPDDPDNEPDSSIELVREPDVPEVGCVSSDERSDRTYKSPQYRDPLIGVLDYIAEVSRSILGLTILSILPASSEPRTSHRT